jgi:flagellar protein FliT
MPDMLGRQERIILSYDAMAGITGKMLAAAQSANWDSLVTLEAECAAQVVTLQRAEPLTALSAGQRQQKAALIVRMLADDGAIRPLVAARMAQLSNQIHSTGTERKLSRAYGA